MYERSSGILLHISSLPGQYGIGDFGKGAYDFVDFLYKAKQKYWQVLPFGVTGYGNSPYSSFSAFAGNPYFIDLDELIREDYLDFEDVNNSNLSKEGLVDFDYLHGAKMSLLRKAYINGKEKLEGALNSFYEEESSWLRHFALYMSLKDKHENKSWQNWESDYKILCSDALKDFENNNNEEIKFWVFTQYYFFKQWLALKEYANKLGIKIIGDLPIYVAEDSADVWANPKLFYLDENLLPIKVSGCPPDAFSARGQLWGNPIYNWDVMEEDGYSWWIQRMKQSFTLYDTVRIDHFRAFEAYWEVDYGADNAVHGKWVRGPGITFFQKLKEELGELDIIAEDLGVYSEELEQLLKDTGYPGMKVLQFAFNSNQDNHHLPHHFSRHCVAYTGTHDNFPVKGWHKQVSHEEKNYALKYFNQCSNEDVHWAFIRSAWSSTAYLAIAQMQDFLGLDEKARMNTPSTIGDNWIWRMKKEDLSDELAEKIADLTVLYGR